MNHFNMKKKPTVKAYTIYYSAEIQGEIRVLATCKDEAESNAEREIKEMLKKQNIKKVLDICLVDSSLVTVDDL